MFRSQSLFTRLFPLCSSCVHFHRESGREMKYSYNIIKFVWSPNGVFKNIKSYKTIRTTATATIKITIWLNYMLSAPFDLIYGKRLIWMHHNYFQYFLFVVCYVSCGSKSWILFWNNGWRFSRWLASNDNKILHNQMDSITYNNAYTKMLNAEEQWNSDSVYLLYIVHIWYSIDGKSVNSVQ